MNQDYQDYQDYYDDDEYEGYDDDDEWEYGDYFEPEELPTRWRRVKAWFNILWWRISSKFRHDEFDDIPF
jgi:hypothetical protein